MEKIGTIFRLCNKINGKNFIGATSRDVELRKEEIFWYLKEGPLYEDFITYGQKNFSIDVLQKVPLADLDHELIKQIKIYDSSCPDKGYNYHALLAGKRILVVENNIILPSVEYFSDILFKTISWNKRIVEEGILDSLKDGKSFLSYHFQMIDGFAPTSEDEIINWALILGDRFKGSHIHLKELDLDFSTPEDAANYLLQVGIVSEDFFSLVKAIKFSIKNFSSIEDKNLTFRKYPGKIEEETKEKRIFCPELNLEFNSSKEAASFIKEHLSLNMKEKTIKQKIDFVLNGYYLHFMGFTFQVL